MTKLCLKCKIEKETAAFSRQKRAHDGLQGWCKTCATKTQQMIKARDPVKYLAKAAVRCARHKAGHLVEFRKSDAARAKVRRLANAGQSRWERYRLSEESFQSMFSTQEGRCAICLDPIKEKSLHVDHCHATNKIRGLLCGNCNWGLGNFKDSPMRLLLAIRYLQKS